MYWLPLILILPYFFLFLEIYRNLRKIIPFKSTGEPSTFVSVVVACKNEQERIPVLLENISSQDYPREHLEIIIVDDNSSDNTFETASGNSWPLNLNIMRNRGRGKKEAIKTGVTASSGSLIITTDADCTMGKTWIKTIASFFEKYDPDLIICQVQLEGSSGFFGRFQELEYLSLQGITAGSAMAGKGIMCNGANLAFTRASYLRQMDNLHSELETGDDVFMLHALRKETNSRIMWLESTDSIVSTTASNNIRSFLKQRKRWLSKWNTYNDRFTIVTGILTFTSVLLMLLASVSLFFSISFIWVFLILFILKSVPDFLILRNTTERYGKKHLMSWFIPAQIIYPAYVVGVVLYMMIGGSARSR